MRILLWSLFIVAGTAAPIRADEPLRFCGRTVEWWIETLRDKPRRGWDRRQAVWALGCLGPYAKDAIPDLVALVGEVGLRDEAIDSLVRIGAASEVTVPVLIEQFRKEGCQRLTGMGSFGSHTRVGEHLVKIGGPAVPALLQVLTGPDTSMRVCAAEALGKIGPAAKETVMPLLHAIEKPDHDDHADILAKHAVQALGRIGEDAKIAVPTLTVMLGKRGEGESAEEENEVVRALTRIGAPPIQNRLDIFLRDGDTDAARQLAWLGPRARDAVPALRAALTDKRPEVRLFAAHALVFIEPPALDSLPVLIEPLTHLDDEKLDYSEVIPTLARMGPAANAAIPKLIGLLPITSYDSEILTTLVQIDPEGKQCIPALVSALEKGDADAAEGAARCLGLLGPRAKDAVPALAKAMTRDFGDARFNLSLNPRVSAANALRRIGPAAKSAIPALIEALKYSDGQDNTSTSSAAARVLGSLGAEAKAAVPALIEAVELQVEVGELPDFRKAAILALGQIGPESKAAIPLLRRLAKAEGRDAGYVCEVLVALSQLTPDGKELAIRWLEKPVDSKMGWNNSPWRLREREMLAGAIGRPNYEADWVTRELLKPLQSMLAHSYTTFNGENDNYEILEEWFDVFGRLGPAARIAVPLFTKLQTHPNPWIRMWAREALSQIDRK